MSSQLCFQKNKKLCVSAGFILFFNKKDILFEGQPRKWGFCEAVLIKNEHRVISLCKNVVCCCSGLRAENGFYLCMFNVFDLYIVNHI